MADVRLGLMIRMMNHKAVLAIRRIRPKHEETRRLCCGNTRQGTKAEKKVQHVQHHHRCTTAVIILMIASNRVV
ncbi:uncharacterized protein EAE98_007690 [Botrytis deweyae]|uniref:Uncharacterized protein n=1 Tax=Botrytis deweyae TaxID=2478750 RepID=A0ABQ7IHG0_9HELO|nr:uncharacterized protein EAE98_007690 [Botrytis deweyae]KAF7923872.1 hypothetical protein EAE98_007690 [Botrytis deweyae]